MARGRRTLKCWGVVYTCLASRAVVLYECPGYDADSFLAIQTKFTAVYGEPEKCYADHGTQILVGAKRLGSTTGTGTKNTPWVFTAMGCSWTNGAAEVTIRSARRTLAHMLEKGGKNMDFHEVDAILRRVGEILNRRPLVVKVGQDDQ